MVIQYLFHLCSAILHNFMPPGAKPARTGTGWTQMATCTVDLGSNVNYTNIIASSLPKWVASFAYVL